MSIRVIDALLNQVHVQVLLTKFLEEVVSHGFDPDQVS
jgi:hypothetical protein